MAIFPDIRWQFPFDPAYSWFPSFASQFSSPDVAITIDTEDGKPDAYAFSSAHLTELDDVNLVWERAEALKSILDGAFYLTEGSKFRPFKLTRMYDAKLKRPCHNANYNFDGTAMPFSPNSGEWINLWHKNLAPHTTVESELIHLAREDQVTRGMLQFLGLNGCSWIALYALLDFMKNAKLSVSDIAALGQTSGAEINRFTHTANNFAAIGPLARHGDLGWQPPPNPMKIDEAANIILPAAKGYLQARFTEIIARQEPANEG